MEGCTIYSNCVHVDSGIPPGTVLGPLLFLCHTNDLPLSVDSKIRLFADDSLICTGKLSLLKIKYNFKKTLTHCKTGPKTGACASTHKSATFYPLLQLENRLPIFISYVGEILQSVPNTPYLGVTLSTDLKFNIHLNKNHAKSYQCL